MARALCNTASRSAASCLVWFAAGWAGVACDRSERRAMPVRSAAEAPAAAAPQSATNLPAPASPTGLPMPATSTGLHCLPTCPAPPVKLTQDEVNRALRSQGERPLKEFEDCWHAMPNLAGGFYFGRGFWPAPKPQPDGDDASRPPQWLPRDEVRRHWRGDDTPTPDCDAKTAYLACCIGDPRRDPATLLRRLGWQTMTPAQRATLAEQYLGQFDGRKMEAEPSDWRAVFPRPPRTTVANSDGSVVTFLWERLPKPRDIDEQEEGALKARLLGVPPTAVQGDWRNPDNRVRWHVQTALRFGADARVTEGPNGYARAWAQLDGADPDFATSFGSQTAGLMYLRFSLARPSASQVLRLLACNSERLQHDIDAPVQLGVDATVHTDTRGARTVEVATADAHVAQCVRQVLTEGSAATGSAGPAVAELHWVYGFEAAKADIDFGKSRMVVWPPTDETGNAYWNSLGVAAYGDSGQLARCFRHFDRSDHSKLTATFAVEVAPSGAVSAKLAQISGFDRPKVERETAACVKRRLEALTVPAYGTAPRQFRLTFTDSLPIHFE